MDPNSSGGNPYLKKRLYQRIHNRLSSQAVFSAVRYDPSKARPRVICADVDPALFVGAEHPTEHARLEIEFDRRSE